jgi:hypothetical protein
MSFVPNPLCPWVQAEHGAEFKVEGVGYAGPEYTVGNLGIYVACINQRKVRLIVPFSLLLPESAQKWKRLFPALPPTI